MPNYYNNYIDPFELRASSFNTELDKLDAQIKANADAIASSGTEFDANALIPQGRLTLSSTLPVPIADVTAATTLYYLPYNGGYISIYNGTAWALVEIPSSGVSISVPASTNTNYDVFAYDGGGGSLTLELVAWSSGTARATSIVRQDGVYCKQGELTKRYIGTIRTTGVSGQCEDSVSKRFVWNAYNRKERKLLRRDTTASWDYSTATFRQANGSGANLVEVVVGLAEDAVDVVVNCGGQAGSWGVVGVGVDSTSTDSSDTRVSAGIAFGLATATYKDVLSIGYHYLAWLENGGGTTTTTFFSNTFGIQAGINARVMA